MRIAIKCEKCGAIFLQDSEDDLTLELDFKEKQLRFLCRNKKCGHDNVLDFSTWQKKQQQSPLPRIGVSNG